MAHWKVNFDDIDLGECLGEGNFGAVYKGEYMGTKVAVKKLFFVDDDFMQKYIEREMDTLTSIHHPNIVQLMGICINGEDVYIITEFISGGDLCKHLHSSAEISWAEKVGYLRDIALAMTYLHAKDIMHRDLKSHNLLIDGNGKIKVCDFGLARSGSEGKNKTIVGTMEWMAPEIAMGNNYDRSADVFSFAIVMYEVITRGDPPKRKLPQGYKFIPEDHKPNIPEDTPEELWKILCDCAEQNPPDRPPFKDVVKRLSALADSLGSEAPKKKKKSADGEKKKKKKSADGEKKKKKKSADGEKKKKKKSADGEKKKKTKKTEQ